MSEEEIVNEFKSIINSIYLQGFIKDNNGKISTLLKNLLDLYKKQEKVIQGLNKQADELVDDYEKQLQEKNEYIFRLESERDRWE